MNDFKKIYLDWLNQNIEQKKITDNTYRITLPFLDRHNDMIDIYIIKQRENYLLTDDGNTIHDLEISGIGLEKGRRKELLDQMLTAYGVKMDDNCALTATASISDLPLKKHMLSQCILKIDDMFYLSKRTVRSMFLDDVQKFLDENDVRYIPRISFTGKSGLPTMYDFSIAKYRNIPERNIKVVNQLTKDHARSIIFGWTDTKDARNLDSKLYAFINDDSTPSSDAINALKEYKITPVMWASRTQYIEELIA